MPQTHFWFHKHLSLTLEEGCQSATGQFSVCSGALFKPAICKSLAVNPKSQASTSLAKIRATAASAACCLLAKLQTATFEGCVQIGMLRPRLQSTALRFSLSQPCSAAAPAPLPREGVSTSTPLRTLHALGKHAAAKKRCSPPPNLETWPLGEEAR